MNKLPSHQTKGTKDTNDTNKDMDHECGYKCFDILEFKFEHKGHVAAFDYDHTLVKPTKGTFSHAVDDWVWLRESVPSVVRGFYERHYTIVIFTNQSKEFKLEQIKLALGSLNIPIRVYAGVSQEARKPNTLMWDAFCDSATGNINKAESFFVGDALGRVCDWSDSDKIFADNIGLKALSPETVFPFEDKVVPDLTGAVGQEVVLMMGYPGSGKSTYVRDKIPDTYTKLSGDVLKTDAKKKKAMINAIGAGESVVIDATHASKKKRQIFVGIAQEKGVPVRLVHLTTDFEQSKARNAQRETKVPIMALYIYRKHYEPPSLDEGLVEIIRI